MVVLELQNDEAVLFREFQRRYDIIAPIVGYMESLKIMDISNSQIILDIDDKGLVKHMAITKHYR